MTDLETKIAEADHALAMLTNAVRGTADDQAEPSAYDELLALQERNYEALLALYERQQTELERVYRDYAALGQQYESAKSDAGVRMVILQVAVKVALQARPWRGYSATATLP